QFAVAPRRLANRGVFGQDLQRRGFTQPKPKHEHTRYVETGIMPTLPRDRWRKPGDISPGPLVDRDVASEVMRRPWTRLGRPELGREPVDLLLTLLYGVRCLDSPPRHGEVAYMVVQFHARGFLDDPRNVHADFSPRRKRALAAAVNLDP